MDTSKQYIEMCSKATEIQKQIKEDLDNGDFYCDNEYPTNNMDYVRVNCPQLDDCYPNPILDTQIWLPRQDQLQEMLGGNFFENLEKFNSFMYSSGIIKIKSNLTEDQLEKFKEEWIRTINDSSFKPLVIETEDIDFINVQNPFTSLEQLWLAFVMKEKYNKIWNQKNKEWEQFKS